MKKVVSAIVLLGCLLQTVSAQTSAQVSRDKRMK